MHRPDPVTPEHADPRARRSEALAGSMLIPTPPTLGPHEPAWLDSAGETEMEMDGWGLDEAWGELDAALFPPSAEDDGDLLAAAAAAAVGPNLASSGASSRTMGGQQQQQQQQQHSQPAFFDDEFLQTTRDMRMLVPGGDDDQDAPGRPAATPSTPTSTSTPDSSSRDAAAGTEADVRSPAVPPRAAPHETPSCMPFEAMALHPSRTFFRTGELLHAHAHAHTGPHASSSRFELFARVAHSGRENFGHRQYFHLRDLLAADAPAVLGLLAGWDAGGTVDRAAREFLAPLAEGQLGLKCYCVGELRADLLGDGDGGGGGGGGWAVLVREIRPVLWRDVLGAMEVLGRDDLDRWVC
ncbi:hypothetical protein ESCO_005694 [Escovopsis weberi]|uniref:Uncharacterized protein n=1 Tax=Escovopsis weberi TaxID=150374 RepID=A0A0M8MWA2_ESCWE|nr:hypothetical protein ESCO_005694 [Escovopsis weberi]